MSKTFSQCSQLRASVKDVWAHVGTFTGVNRELWPFARMTFPESLNKITPENIPLGQPAFRAWILLFGFIPVDYDDFTLLELKPGQGFCESSRLFTMLLWKHRRTITPTSTGCELLDELTYIPRWHWMGTFLGWVYRQVFAMRHRKLRRIFGGA
ncbi:MAG: hypothetical protein WCJ35_28855 [Planctomycetota bacterium]